MSIFQTQRLVIRQWTESPADLARCFDIYSRWEVARWLGATPKVLTEPARGAVERAFGAGIGRVHAVVRPGNHASVAVTRRLGMAPLGRTDRWYGGVALDAFVLAAGGRSAEAGQRG